MDQVSRALLGTAGASEPPAPYSNDVFSTFVYTGNGGTTTITNDVNLSTNGGMVWFKRRDATGNYNVIDSARGFGAASPLLVTNTNDIPATSLTTFTPTTTGITLTGTGAATNANASNFVSWTFRNSPKFFEAITYTGNGSNLLSIPHNLGVVPGLIITKCTSSTGTSWSVTYLRGDLVPGETIVASLNSTSAAETTGALVSTYFSSSAFKPTGLGDTLNATGGFNNFGETYVSYLFAHDSNPDGIIRCGFYNGDASTVNVTLGWEPQWLMIKRGTTGSGSWYIFDFIRGITSVSTSSNDAYLLPNSTSAELLGSYIAPTSTGFQITTSSFLELNGGSSVDNYIYVAIRIPNKPPTTGSQVFMPTVYTGTNVDNRLVDTTIAPDMVWMRQRNSTSVTGFVVGDRLRGQGTLLTGAVGSQVFDADSLDQQIASVTEYGTAFTSMNGVWVGNDITRAINANTTANNHIALAFKRAPKFFDMLTYVGNSGTQTIQHQLSAEPELVIIKAHDVISDNWLVYCKHHLDNSAGISGTNGITILNAADAVVGGGFDWWGNNTQFVSPTSTTFTVGSYASINGSGRNFIMYLFATLAGISKVGNYLGNGTTVTVPCGFTTAPRFVMIKCMTTAGNWIVVDTARGIGDATPDAVLTANTSNSENNNNNCIDLTTSGFGVVQEAGYSLNASGQYYMYLAIA